MEILTNDICCAISIRGIRSSITKEMIRNYCEKYGIINYFHCAFSPQGIMRGYNVVFHDKQSVNRFMDSRPHQIDGQSVKVKRCIYPNEECRLTNDIILTTSDHSMDKHIFQEQTLRDYFSKYGRIRACRIETSDNHPCAYLTFNDYDQVDQLINDKPHIINKIILHIRKYISTDHQTSRTSIKRAISNSSSNKQRRYSSINHVDIKQNIHDHNDIFHLQEKYEQFNHQMININEQISIDDCNHQYQNEILNKLENNVENLLQQIRNIQQKKKTFIEELFEKYTLTYILTLTENDLNQRLEQLEKESYLLQLIKQNMPSKKINSNIS